MKNLSLKAVVIGPMAALMVANVALSVTSPRNINMIGASTQELGDYRFQRIVSAPGVMGAFPDMRLAYAQFALVSGDAEFQAKAKLPAEVQPKLTDDIAKYEARIPTETG